MIISETPREQILQEKSEVMQRIFLVILVIGSMMSVVRYLNGDIQQATADAFLAIIVLLSYTALKYSVNYYLPVVRFVFLIAFAASLHAAMHLHSPLRFIWLSATVYFIYFAFPPREATKWLMAFFGVMAYLGFFSFDLFHLGLVEYLLWMLNIVLVLLVSKWYLDLEKESIRRLQNIEYALRCEVTDKTAALEQKTKALEELNATLEQKIEEKIEENRKQEQMLSHQTRYAQMGEMLNMIAHQWRQPLNAISVTSYTVEKLVKKYEDCPPKILDYISKIGNYTRHLSETIQDFRNFFRFENEKKYVPLASIIQNAYNIMKPLLVQNHIRMTYKCDEDIIFETYPNEVLQALLNVLRNAQEALESSERSEPEIIIRGYQEEEFVCIEVIDNAGGISDTIKERIFDPYFSTKSREGRGLGLYMVKLIIEHHCGGHVEMDSNEQGTKIRFRLPSDEKK